MMKQHYCVLFACLLAFLFGCEAQTPASSGQPNATSITCAYLEGKQFQISLTTGGKVEGSEVLSFRNNTVESSECLQYGFAAVPFTCSVGTDGSLQFEAVMNSEKEGRMDWKGTANAAKVYGTILWVKAGQADIAYTFDGPLK